MKVVKKKDGESKVGITQESFVDSKFYECIDAYISSKHWIGVVVVKKPYSGVYVVVPSPNMTKEQIVQAMGACQFASDYKFKEVEPGTKFEIQF